MCVFGLKNIYKLARRCGRFEAGKLEKSDQAVYHPLITHPGVIFYAGFLQM